MLGFHISKRTFFPSYLRRAHATGERGATLLELAIVIPLFLFFLFIIFDFSRLITRRTLISNAMRVAVRSAATQTQNCAASAELYLQQELGRFNLATAVVAGSVQVERITDFVCGTTVPVEVLQLSARVTVPCFLCPLFRHGLPVVGVDSGMFDFQRIAIAPLELPGSCTDVTVSSDPCLNS